MATAGCDAGHQTNSGTPGAPIEIVSVNVGSNQSIAAGTPIEIAFDRLLLPTSVTRQTFAVRDLFGNFLEPTPSYDPVARVVRLCVPLQVDQSYTLTILSPQDAGDPAGLRAIDGAHLDPSATATFTFPVVSGAVYAGPDACPGGDAGASTATSPIDFCGQVLPIFANKCGTSACHDGLLPAEGLQLTSAQGVLSTAIGRVSQEANTGTRSAVVQGQASTNPFGSDMAIIGPADPGESWLLYKLLLADPPSCSSTPPSTTQAADAGCYEGPEVGTFHDVPWAPVSSDERAALSNLMPGREMPFPSDPSAALDSGTNTFANLTVDELEVVAFWIQQGAVVPSCTP